MRLSVGPSPAAKGFATVVAVILFMGGLCFAGLAFGMGSFFDSWGSFYEDPFAGDPVAPPPVDTPIDEGFSFFSMVAKLMGLCGLPFSLAAVYLLLHLWRFEMRLDGTILTRRGALRTTRTDLATAEVSMGGVTYTQRVGTDRRAVYRIPALLVTDAATSRTVKVPLRGQGLDLLPPSQLRALADVLERNTSPDAERARGIGAHLRRLADDPVAY